MRVCKQAWPTVDLSSDRFAEFIAKRGVVPADDAASLERARDLYIACACIDGDKRAHSAFDREYLTRLDATIARTVGDSRVSDVKQSLREKLFLSTPERPAKLGDWSGRGDLLKWLRAVAVRLSIDLVRSDKGDVELDDELERRLVEPGGDPELERLKSAYRDEFRAAFRSALESLDARSRALLRHYYVDGLNLEALASRFRVHASTISRSLEKTRRDLMNATRAAFAEKLSMTQIELESVIRMIDSRLEISLAPLLRV